MSVTLQENSSKYYQIFILFYLSQVLDLLYHVRIHVAFRKGTFHMTFRIILFRNIFSPLAEKKKTKNMTLYHGLVMFFRISKLLLFLLPKIIFILYLFKSHFFVLFFFSLVFSACITSDNEFSECIYFQLFLRCLLIYLNIMSRKQLHL